MTQQRKRIYTLGYEGSKWEIIKTILQENDITHLIDIRRNNNYKSPFKQYHLETMCSDLEIIYIHEPNLAPSNALLRNSNRIITDIKKQPKEIQQSMIRSYYQNEFHKNYLAEMESLDGRNLCFQLVLSAERPCFISKNKLSEIATSHRKMLLDYVLKNQLKDMRIIHLDETFYQTGRIHNLREVFTHVNETYFKGKIKRSELVFSWRKLPGQMYRFVHGRFLPPNTIRMNVKLDTHAIPVFFINAVFYHELLHYVRFRDGLPYKHSVDFYVQELDFKDAGVKFHFMREFYKKHLPEIHEELGLSDKSESEIETMLEPLFQELERIFTGKAENHE